MKEYVFSLVCVSLVAAVFGILCPGDAAGQKSVRFVISIVIISMIFLPPSRIKELINDDYFVELEGMLGSYDDGRDTSGFLEGFRKYGTDYVNAQIKSEICKSLDITQSNCRAIASFTMNDGVLHLEKITVILSGKAIWKDPHAIEKYVRDSYGCDCNVALE